jgi:hypothetical protein
MVNALSGKLSQIEFDVTLTKVIICVTFSVYLRHIVQRQDMNRKQTLRYFVAGVLIFSMLGFFSWKTLQSRAQPEDVCVTESQEKPDRKVKTGLPMWESLSRHLITIQR